MASSAFNFSSVRARWAASRSPSAAIFALIAELVFHGAVFPFAGGTISDMGCVLAVFHDTDDGFLSVFAVDIDLCVFIQGHFVHLLDDDTMRLFFAVGGLGKHLGRFGFGHRLAGAGCCGDGQRKRRGEQNGW